MALIDDYNAWQNSQVQGQVTAAIYQIAQNVYTEVSTTPGHATRAQFATKVLTGLQSLSPLIQAAVASGNLGTASTDAAALNQVSAMWNSWAGA